ncbi:hypothetical protein [Streptomyces fuscigenes]|uniref:hypothetical protein n=1 Tax=Streptomyces fuscigenes TaxID=1528880 RepID=UPI001F2B7055|nr:hypothetical protein [Streptomyces fuscigenes]MCF3960619.1 hypothetical protein [Streptomyces fuscigenes]
MLLLVATPCACDGAPPGEPGVVGWLNPTTGTFTPGPLPAGAGPCPDTADCPPVPMCPQLLGLTGPETWSVPDRTESVSVTVACGPVTVTDCAGNATAINECGVGFSWSAPGTPCAPGVLCGSLAVDVPEGSAAYVQWSAPCGGEES